MINLLTLSAGYRLGRAIMRYRLARLSARRERARLAALDAQELANEYNQLLRMITER